MQDITPQPAARPKSTFLRLFRWFFTWRVLRFFVAGFAVLVTLVALFYAEEDWRGKRAWENYKREAESKGAVLDWAAFIPPPVPDDQNIFKAPRMTEWFVGRGANELSQRLGWGSDTNEPRLVYQDGRIKVAVLTVVPPGSPAAGSDVMLHAGNSVNSNLVEKCLRDAAGPSLQGASGYILVARQLDQIKPVRILLEADKTPDPSALLALFPERVIPLSPVIAASAGRLQIEASGNNSFDIWFSAASANCCAALDYLGWSDRFEPDFAIMREGLKRPYARMDGDYGQAYAQPIPNFVLIRNVAQMLSQRAQCNFLLGRPEKALAELTLLHNLSRLLEARPTGKPMTLVSAMINVAITGIYVQTVADGFQLQAWREPQLIQLQEHLGEVRLAPLVAESFRTERAGLSHTLATASPTTEFTRTLGHRTTDSLWQRLKDPWLRFWTLAPRGWIYQNMISFDQLHQEWDENAELPDGQIYPRKLDSMVSEISDKIAAASPYSYLALRALPNLSAALRTTAYNQTRINEALIACALERSRLASGQYPESLSALVPQYLGKLPRDLIGGQPLKYHRTEDARYVLYSVGWNETDDGGTIVPDTGRNVSPASFQGDWVWPQPPAK